MSTETVASFFGLLLIGGLVGSLGLFVIPETRPTLVAAAPRLALLVAAGATAGSLYFSERAGFVPCELCWFQRIAMYPMVVLLGIAAIRRDRQIMNYAFVLSAIGFVIAAYQIQLQWFPARSSFCEVSNPCSTKWVEAFGWMTIPQMAAMAFALIMALSVASTFDDTSDNPTDTDTGARRTKEAV